MPQADRGQGIKDRQEIEDREEGEGTRGEGWIFTLWGEGGEDKGLPLEKGDRRGSQENGRFIKGKEKSVLGQSVLILIGHVN